MSTKSIGNGLATPIPKPSVTIFPTNETKLVDPHGKTIRSERPSGFLAMVDAKGSEKVELSKATVFLIGLACTIATLAFSYGGVLMSWAGENGAERERMIRLEKDLETIKGDVREINQRSMAEQEKTRHSVDELKRDLNDFRKEQKR